jgi:hypothetical protein
MIRTVERELQRRLADRQDLANPQEVEALRVAIEEEHGAEVEARRLEWIERTVEELRRARLLETKPMIHRRHLSAWQKGGQASDRRS